MASAWSVTSISWKGPPAVAAAAAGVGAALAEVAQNVGPQAVPGLAVGRHVPQPLPVLLPQGRLLGRGEALVFAGIVDEEFRRADVAGREQQNAVGGAAIPTGTAGLLVVALQVLGHVIVNHKGDVGLVDAHAEGVGGHHDGFPVVGEILLILPPLLIVQARVVAGGGEAVVAEGLADPFHVGPGGAVDDAAAAPALPQQLQQAPGLFLRALHVEKEVFPVEARDHGPGLPKPQEPDDVRPDLPGGRSREGRQKGPPGQSLHKVRDLQIAGAEILSPLADAVGLVHGHQGDVRPGGKVEEALGGQPLRGHIDDLIGAPAGPSQGLAVLGKAQGGIEISRRNPGLAQGHDLILHQGDQGRHHQGDPRQHQGGNLIAHGLAGAGGHDAQNILPVHQGVDEAFLPRTKGVVAEIFTKQGAFVHGSLRGEINAE